MKAQIIIIGQIGGNFKLKSKISCNGNYTTIDKGMFNNYYINFDTVKEAKQALKKAWQSIKREDDELNWTDGLNKGCTNLRYDASAAILNKKIK